MGKEREKILQLLADGKISPQEADKLIDAIGKKTKPTVIVKSFDEAGKKINLSGKLRIEVKSADGDDVKIAVPLKLANLITTFIPKDKISNLEESGVNLNEIFANIDEFTKNMDEDIVNIQSADGDHVRIYIEK